LGRSDPKCAFSTHLFRLLQVVPSAEGKRLADELGARFLEVSAKSAAAVEQAFHTVAAGIKAMARLPQPACLHHIFTFLQSGAVQRPETSCAFALSSLCAAFSHSGESQAATMQQHVHTPTNTL
jgi:hypothetical protein